MLKSLTLTVTLIFFSANSRATIIYDESVNGDAPSTAGSALVGANVGTLALGDNIILGSSTSTSTRIDFDDYIFEIATGQILLDFSFSTFTDSINWGADLYTGSGTLLSTLLTSALSIGSTVPAFSSGLPLSSGVYRIDGNRIPAEGFYSWTLTTSPDAVVPIPATLLLLGAGLAGLGWSRRKKA